MPTRLRHRPDLGELLDRGAPDARTLGANLRDIRLINRYLGWTAAMTRELAAVTRRLGLRDFTLLDVATGSADIPLAIVRWARGRGLRPRLVAGDLNRGVLAAARAEVDRGAPGAVALLGFDALRAPFPDRAFDVVTCSLAIHHFPPAEAVVVLRELGRITRRALIINDLERSRPGYLAARLLVTVLRNPLTRHDAPVSFLRAYTRDELAALARAAGLRGARVAGRFPFRLALVWSPPADGVE